MKKILKNWQWILHGAVLIGLVIAGLKYLKSDALWEAIEHFNWLYAPLIVGLTVVYMIAKGWRFAVPLRQVRKVNPWTVVRCYAAGQPASLMPGGAAAYPTMLKQAGVGVDDSTAAILLASLLDQTFLISASIIAAFWVPMARKAAIVVTILLAVLALLLFVRVSRLWIRIWLEMLILRLGFLPMWRAFLQSLRIALNPTVLLPAMGLTLVAAATMVLALNLAVSGVGADVTLAGALLAYALPAMLGRATPLPGGIGVTEASMIALLQGSPDISLGQAAAAVAIFRVGTTFMAALLGAGVYIFAWDGKHETAHEGA